MNAKRWEELPTITREKLLAGLRVKDEAEARRTIKELDAVWFDYELLVITPFGIPDEIVKEAREAWVAYKKSAGLKGACDWEDGRLVFKEWCK